MKLIIVESPTKAKTLSTFLGKGYSIISSKGHIRDLPKSKLGVDVEHNFEPTYVTSEGKGAVVDEISKLCKQADSIYLATDLDREGESIAWHIGESAGIFSKNFKKEVFRIVFHEVTKSAIEDSIAHPRKLDVDLVDAQQARRVLDRLVGYKLSPLLWEKIRYGLSAGRVQSVALKLIVDRELERLAFKIEDYYTIEGLFLSDSHKNLKIKATLTKFNNEQVTIPPKKISFPSLEYATEALGHLRKRSFSVEKITKTEKKRNPNPPFITSSLQRAGVNVFSWSSKKTMQVAQKLYEHGFITYMRTDSVYLAESFREEAKTYILKNFSAKHLPEKDTLFKSSNSKSQEAHEAIRPVSLKDESLILGKIQKQVGVDGVKLFNLIKNRALESLMSPALVESTSVTIVSAYGDQFNATGQVILFDGFMAISKSQDIDTQTLPHLREGEELKTVTMDEEFHQTQPPARYTEASLIKILEEKGIGRPSTYAPIIATIMSRTYVFMEGKSLVPTDTGFVVVRLLAENFPQVISVDFTKNVEDELDKVAEGKLKWQKMLEAFYTPFAKELESKRKSIKKEDYAILEKLDRKCPECGEGLIVKLSKVGKFISCSDFPKCKYSESIDIPGQETTEEELEETKLPCENCGGNMVIKVGRFGKFVACENYPKCKNTRKIEKKIGMVCPKCKVGEIVIKKSRFRKEFFGCDKYPDCDFASWKNPLLSDEDANSVKRSKKAVKKNSKTPSSKTTKSKTKK